MSGSRHIQTGPSSLKFYLSCSPFISFFSALSSSSRFNAENTFQAKFGCQNRERRNGVGVRTNTPACVYVRARVPDSIRKRFSFFLINPNVVPVLWGLNTDNSQLIINAILILPKCQVTQIVGGVFSHKYTHPHTDKHKAILRQRPNVSDGTERTLHKSNKKKAAKSR